MTTLGNRAKNARRAAERRISALDKELSRATNDRDRRAITKQIEEVKTLAYETRMYSEGRKITGRTVEQREQAISQLESFNKTVSFKGRQLESSNIVFMQDVAAVSRGASIEGMSELEMRVFWRATQHAWEGAPTSKRYEQILEYYGTDNLNEIYEAVMEQYGNIANVLEKLDRGERLTDEEKKLMIDLKRIDDEQTKKYSKESDVIVGTIASNVTPFTREDFELYTEDVYL